MPSLSRGPVNSDRQLGILSFREAFNGCGPLNVAFISPIKDEKGKNLWEFATRRETYLTLLKMYYRNNEKLAEVLSISSRKTLMTYILPKLEFKEKHHQVV